MRRQQYAFLNGLSVCAGGALVVIGILGAVAAGLFFLYGAFDDRFLDERNVLNVLTGAVVGILLLNIGLIVILLKAILQRISSSGSSLEDK